MANHFGSFAGGLASGMALGKGLTDLWHEGDLSAESERLNKKMDDSGKSVANEGGGLSKAMPDAKTANNYADYNNKIAAEDAATFGGGLSSAPTTTVDTNPTYTRADYYSDMGRKASGLGMMNRADKYQQQSRQEKSDELNQKEQSQRIEKGQMDINHAKAAEESQKRLEAFYASIDAAHQDAAKNGGGLSWDQIQEMGRSAGLKPSEVMTAASALTGLDEQGTKYTAGMRVAQFDKAFHTGGLDAVKDLYHNNPIFNDGSNIDFKKVKGGKVIPLVNGKPMVDSPMSEDEAAVYLRNHLTDPYSAVKFNMEVLQNHAKLRDAESKLKVDAANITQSNASAANSFASAAKTRAEIKAGGNLGDKPSDIRQNANAAVKQVLLATGLAKQDPVGNLFMQGADGKQSSAEQDIANLSAEVEALVHKGIPPYQAAQKVIKDRTDAKTAAAAVESKKQSRPAITSFDQ